LDLVLVYLRYPYEKIDDTLKKYQEIMRKSLYPPDLFDPKPIQVSTPWFTKDNVIVTTIFRVKEGKLKEAIDFLNIRKKWWPIEEGYIVDTWISKIEKSEKRRSLLFGENFLIFVSYATKDAQTFKISEIAEELRRIPEIKKVLYWQEHMHDNIFKFMNDNLGKCDVMLLFCSKNALNSIPVQKEWTAAEAMGIPIIPIYIGVDHIPPLLKSRLGIEYDFNDIDKNIQELRILILKKIKGVVD